MKYTAELVDNLINELHINYAELSKECDEIDGVSLKTQKLIAEYGKERAAEIGFNAYLKDCLPEILNELTEHIY